MRRISQMILMCSVCLAAVVAPALAQVTFGQWEDFNPAREEDRKAVDKRHTILHLPGRVYLRENHFDGFGHKSDEGVVAYQGSAEAVNRALIEFGQLPGEVDKEIHLLPAPGVSRSLKQKVVQPCDFEIRWKYVEALQLEKDMASSYWQATFVIYIDRAAPPQPLDSRARKWIEELDDTRFGVRQAAFEQLEKQRDAALPLLRESLEATDLTLERRRRVEQLLKRLEPIHAARLHFPKGTPVVGVDELLKREAGERAKSWFPSGAISALAEFTEESFPLLVEMLQDRREHVREAALGAFQRLGSRAAGVAPALKAAEAKATPDVRAALGKALAAATSAPPVEDAWRQNRQRCAEIAQFLREKK
jgi:hypothetical protein